MNDIKSVLRDIRKANKLTQKDFADRIGMKQNSYSMLESGKNTPQYETINAIVREFKVDANVFFDALNSNINKTPGDHESIIINDILSTSNNSAEDSGMKQLMNRLYENPNWQLAQNLKLEIYDLIKQNELSKILSDLKLFRDKVARILNYVNSLDYILTSSIERDLFESLNSGHTHDDLLKEAKSKIKLLEKLHPILKELNIGLTISINKLSDQDDEKMLEVDILSELKQRIVSQKFDEAAKIRDKISLSPIYINP